MCPYLVLSLLFFLFFVVYRFYLFGDVYSVLLLLLLFFVSCLFGVCVCVCVCVCVGFFSGPAIGGAGPNWGQFWSVQVPSQPATRTVELGVLDKPRVDYTLAQGPIGVSLVSGPGVCVCACARSIVFVSVCVLIVCVLLDGYW